MKATLSDLVNPNLSIELNGKTYPVKPMDGFGYQLLSSLTPDSSVDVMYRLAQRVLAPSMSKDEVFGTEDVLGLTPGQVAEVVKVSSGQVDAVEETIPNGSGPLEQGQNRTLEVSPESRQQTLLAS